jgi:S-adenosylmethionine synthetase
MNKKTIVCEYVGFGHPDKVADQVSDALLDEFLKQDPNTRAGIEVMVKDNIVVLGGEVNSRSKIDYDSVVRRVFASLPYPANHHLSADEIKVINLIGKQSPEISRGVDREDGIIGAGDQGWVCAMASNDTNDYLPLGVHIAKKICQYVAAQTELGLGPDCKSQVIVEYDEKGHAKVDSILVSTMQQGILESDRKAIETAIRCNKMGMDKIAFMKYLYLTAHRPQIIVNPNGEWRMGGSVSDCGMTGRKIVVNQFGGYCPVGGGNLHGKDMSKVDRSAAYMCRYLAKNIVAAGVANTAKVELSYMIGVAQPSSIHVELTGSKYNVNDVTEWIKANVDLSPGGIISRFGGYPRYLNTARYGHYGKTDEEMKDKQTAGLYPWEKTDLTESLFHFLNTKK